MLRASFGLSRRRASSLGSLVLLVVWTCTLNFGCAQQIGEMVLQSGHRGAEARVGTAVFSPNGRMLLTAGGTDFEAVLWDATTGRQLRSFAGDTIFIKAVDLSANQSWALTVTERGTLRTWDIRSGRQRASTELGMDTAAAKISPDGSHIVVAGSSGKAVILDAETLKQVGQLSVGEGDVTSISFSRQENTVAVSGEAFAGVFDLASGKLIRPFDLPKETSSTVVFGADGKTVYGLGSDDTMRVWDATTGHLFRSVEVSHPLALSPDETSILGVDSAGDNILVDARTGKTILRYLAPIASFATFSQDGRSVLGAGQDGLWLYETATGKRSLPFASMTFRITGASLSGDGRYLALSGGVNRLWDFETGRQITSFGDDFDSFRSIAITSDGLDVLTGSMDGQLRRWLANTGEEVTINSVNLHDEIRAISLSRDGREWLLQTFNRGAVVLNHDEYQNPAGGKVFQGSEGYAAAISPAGDRAVTSYGARDAMIWNARTGEAFQHLVLPASASTLRSAAFSNDGAYVATGSYDGAVRLWNAANGKLIATFSRHAQPVTAVAISPDNHYVLSGSGFMSGGDNSVRLWDVATGKQLLKMDGHMAAVRYVGFLPSGLIVSAGEDGTVRLWDATNGANLCSLFSLKEGHWIALTPNGRFDSDTLEDLRAAQILPSEDPLQPKPVEQFMSRLYEPRLIPRIIAGESFDEDPGAAPVIGTEYRAWFTGVALNAEADAADVRVRIALATQPVPAASDETDSAELHLFRNGQLVAVKKIQGGLIESGKNVLFEQIALPTDSLQHQVVFSCYVLNRMGIKGETARRIVHVHGSSKITPGITYVVSIGVSQYANPAWNLRWSANDAEAMTRTLSRWIGETKRYSRVVTVTLDSPPAATRSLPTKKNIQSVLKRLAGQNPGNPSLREIANAEELNALTPNDMLILTFSGHGYRSPDGRYFLVPYDAQPGSGPQPSTELLGETSISTDELEQWLRPLDAGNIALIIDACHSGAAFQAAGFKPGPMGSRGLGQLAYEKGIQILAASQSDNVAVESDTYKMGLLSYALLKDAPEYASRSEHAVDDMSLKHWFEYASEKVPSYASDADKEALPVAARPGGSATSRTSATHRPAAKPRASRAVRALVADAPARLASQQPGIFDYTQNSRQLLILPGYREAGREAGQALLDQAQAAQESKVALQKYREAEMEFQEISDDYDWALTRQRAAAILESQKDLDGAVQMLEGAEVLYKRAASYNEAALALANMARLQYSADQPGPTLRMLFVALQREQAEGDTDYADQILRWIAAIYRAAAQESIATAYEREIASAPRT